MCFTVHKSDGLDSAQRMFALLKRAYRRLLTLKNAYRRLLTLTFVRLVESVKVACQHNFSTRSETTDWIVCI